MNTITNQQMLANKMLKANASMIPSPLQNASIKSITIPLFRKAAAVATSINQPLFNLNLHEPINNNESDLTELSWLTNNVQIFTKNMHNSDTSLAYPNQQFNKRTFMSQTTKNLTNSASSAFSNYTKLLNNRNNFRTNRVRKSSMKKEPILARNCEDESSFSSSCSSRSSTSPLSIQPTKITDNSTSISPSSSTSSSSSSNFITKPNDLMKSDDFVSNFKISPDDLFKAKLENIQFKNSCGMSKPPLTLSCLIFMALQESNEKCLPVREIYEWIEKHFPYYKNSSNAGWKSSIRHNLSFSKCFKKMERNDSVLTRIKQQETTNYIIEQNGRKRRAPNSTGTCWAVSPDCKSYLVQTLKKSSFWFHNSKYYSNLNDYVLNFTHNSLDQADPARHPGDTLIRKNQSKKLKISGSDLKLKQHKNKHLDEQFQDDEEESEEEKQSNLIKFVQQQQEQLCKNKYSPNSSFDSNCSENNATSFKIRPDLDSNDLAAAALLASTASAASPPQKSKLDLSLSSSSSSLSSAFSLLSSSSSIPSPVSRTDETDCHHSGLKNVKQDEKEELNAALINLNSDLEMEVASTLVGMKFFARQQH